jgi:hypothetical protein
MTLGRILAASWLHMAAPFGGWCGGCRPLGYGGGRRLGRMPAACWLPHPREITNRVGAGWLQRFQLAAHAIPCVVTR